MNKKRSPIAMMGALLLAEAIVSMLWPATALSEEMALPPARAQAESLRHLLREGELVRLDALLNGAQRDYEGGKLDDEAVGDMFEALAVPDPEFEKPLTAWSEAAPNSYAARLATGLYYLEVGRAWRGTRSADEVHPEQMEALKAAHRKAKKHLAAALKLAEKPIGAYTGLIQMARYNGQREEAEAWIQQTLALEPGAYPARFAYMQMLSPRWGGSYEAMQAFADASRSSMTKPKGDKLAAYIFFDKAMTAARNEDNIAMLDFLSQGIASAQAAYLLVERAQLYRTLGRLDEAAADIERAIAIDPDNGEILEERARLLFTRQRVNEGMRDMHAAAERWNTSAQHMLGDAYAEGTHGLTIQPETGLALIRKSAHYLNRDALLWLGVSYYKGLGLPRNDELAFWHFQRAAAQHLVPAMNELGLMYWYGQGTERDADAAAELWLHAARHGEWRGKHNLDYFLPLSDRLSLLIKHPEQHAILLDGTLRNYAIGAFALLLLLGIWIYQRATAKDEAAEQALRPEPQSPRE